MTRSNHTERKWITEHEKTLLDSPVMKLVQLDCRSSEDPGKTHCFYTLRSHDWCNIIPVTEEGKIVLVRQFRIGRGEQTLEVPGGVIDEKGPNMLNLARDAALRELAEETGYEPLPDAKCVALGSSLTNPAILDNEAHGFIVGPVRRTSEQKLDAGEMIDVIEVALEDLPRMIANGEIAHSIILVTFFHLLMRSESAQAQLVSALNEFRSTRAGSV